jgi:L-asparaginase II
MKQRLAGKPFIEVTRGGRVESVHEVAAFATDAQGRIVLEFGNVDAPVYLRSSAKPFIAATGIIAGVPERFGFDQRELAVTAASHSGEPFHIDAVRSILRKAGLDESALQCGADYPYDAQARAALELRGIPPAPVYHNCSGKHAGILALCRLLGADPASYMDPQNPAQVRILEFCASMSDVRREDLPIAIDGCGIPVYAVPLRNAALSYVRFATLDGIDAAAAGALGRIRDAMIAYPEYMSGTGEFDAALIRAGNGSLVCKGGAEGVHATALIDRGIGLVIKVVDGNERARPPAAIEALRSIGALDDSQCELLALFAHPSLKNRAGRLVGDIRPAEGVQL